MQLSQQYLSKLSHLADGETRIILPANISDFESLLSNVVLIGEKKALKLNAKRV